MRCWLVFISLLLVNPYLRAEEVKGKLVERIVAIVNGKTILWTELKKAQAAHPKESETNILNQLISQIVVDKEIERRGLAANDGVIDGAIAQVMKQNRMTSTDQLVKALKTEGISFEEYRNSIKKQIEVTRLVGDAVKSKIQISDQDVLAEYKKGLGSDDGKTIMKVQMIFKKKLKGKADQLAISRAYRELNAGIPFERIASRETDGPGKEEGGNIGWVEPDQMQKELGEALNQLQAGEISKPIYTKQGSYLLKCVERSQKKNSEELSEGKKDEIREKLTQAETERAFDQLVRDLRAKAQIEVLL